MAEAFRFKRQSNPDNNSEEENSADVGVKFYSDQNQGSRKGTADPFTQLQSSPELSCRNSSPDYPKKGDLGPVRAALNDQLDYVVAHESTTGGHEELGEITSSSKREELLSPQKIAFVTPRGNDYLHGEVEYEDGDEHERELIIVPPETQGSSGLKVVPLKDMQQEGSEVVRGTEDSEKSQDPDGSPESISRLSRIESAKQDIRNLRSATLGRMGKIFKMRPPTPSAGRDKTTNEVEQGVDTANTCTDQQYGENPTRKEKTHSLGRMLRLVDKDGAPKKLFSHPRTGSLTRLRKMNSTVGKVTSSSEESHNIFTRIINQFRGRNNSDANAEPNLQKVTSQTASPKPSLGSRLMFSLSARGSLSANGAPAETEEATEPSAAERVTAMKYVA